MLKKNYRAWQINPNDFSEKLSDTEKLKFFARYAILAPSGHNTQPWKLKIRNESVTVSINKEHYLSEDGSGLLSVEPFISIGTLLEIFVLAARGFGYALSIHLFPHEGQIATIRIKGKVAAKPYLLNAIVTRASNRNPFQASSISQKSLDSIVATRLTRVKTTLITDKNDICFIAEQTEIAVKSIMRKPPYRIELSKWVRTNFTRSYDGMPGFTHGFGDFMSLLSKLAVRHALKYGPQAKKSKDLINKSGALIIVRCINDKKESFIDAGRLFSQICVLANNSGLAASALGASVIDPDTRKKVKQHFNIKDRPIYILRLGKPTIIAPHSPRWPLEKILN